MAVGRNDAEIEGDSLQPPASSQTWVNSGWIDQGLRESVVSPALMLPFCGARAWGPPRVSRSSATLALSVAVKLNAQKFVNVPLNAVA